MKRKEIMEGCPEGFEDELKNIVDYFEGTLTEIRSNLEITQISELGQVEEAYDIVCRIAEDLY